MIDLKAIQELYDRHLFLQAYKESQDCWTPSTDLGSFSIEALVLGGRLAARLGGIRLSRWLFMHAHGRDPGDPRVRYFTMRVRRRGSHLFDLLREFERDPGLDTNDLKVRVSWLASQAVIWASVHDFSRAEECLERAGSLGVDHAWVLSCKSEVLGLADRWEEALTAAHEAWDLNPGAPHAAYCLGSSLLHLGRVEESSRRLALAAESGESFEIAEVAAWHLCALAETLDGEGKQQTLDHAQAVLDGIPKLAPLMDREGRSRFARLMLDIAEQKDDQEGMQHWACEIRSPFYKEMFRNLEKNPRGARLRLPFRRVMQRHDTCLPTSLAAILPTVGVTVDPEEIGRELTYAGTPYWVAAEWLEDRGLAVRFFTVTASVSKALLKAGIPFILGLESESRAHAVAAIGFDEAAGTLFIHDPNSFRSYVYLMDFLGDQEGPLGPKGMAFTRLEDSERLDRLISADDAEAMAALHRHQREMVANGPSSARFVVTSLADRLPHHVIIRYLQAVQTLEEGRAGEALALFQGLMNEHPKCMRIRNGLLWACDGMGNSALTRETLEGVVERGALPGIQSGQDWRYPPIPYLCQLADHLRRSALTRKKGLHLLRAALGRDPSHAEAWHVLGDLLWHERDVETTLLAYRIASCLECTNEHYAQSYADALHEVKCEKQGLDWLEARVVRFASSPRSTGPWISWISALENYGHPEQAVEVCNAALERHGNSSELLSFAVPFLARMGLWESSLAGLHRMEANGHRALYLEAAVVLHRMRGDLSTALSLCEAWLDESHRSLPARQVYLDLIASLQGVRAAADLSAKWSEEIPGHDHLEELHYQWLRSLDASEDQDALLVRRLKRNTHDGWAWRETTLRRLADFDALDDSKRAEMQPLILKLLAQCRRTAPEDAATRRVWAEWYAVRGLWEQAVETCFDAMNLEPGNFYTYRRAWDLAPRFSDAGRRKVLHRMEEILLRSPGRWSIARDLVPLIAARFGVKMAEDAVLRWLDAHPDDPEVIEAYARLLLEYGHGRSDAQRALAVLEPAASRFPYHRGLRFALAQAQHAMGLHEAAEVTYSDIVRRHPDDTDARIQLAWLHEKRGELDRSSDILEEAAQVAPLDPDVWGARARLSMRSERYEEAQALVRKGLERLPENVGYRETAIDLLFECGDDEGALQAARDGIAVHPQGAYLWYLLADALNRARHLSTPGEMESCLRSALTFNVGLYCAADALAMILVEQRRYDEAEEVIRCVLPRLADPSWPRGRLAWILHERGKTEDALAAMKALVRDMPWFRWAWDRLMDWLEQEARWEEAHELLEHTPPELLTDTPFRRRRLFLLAETSLSRETIDGEWDELLNDFPEDVLLHLQRYDDLHARSAYEQSRSVLDAIRPMAPDDPYVLARWVEVLAESGQSEEAVEGLLQIWFAEVEESPWPARYAWDAARRVDLGHDACRRAKKRMQEGARPTLEALSILAEHAMGPVSEGHGDPKRGWRGWLPGRDVREVTTLLELVDRAPWANGRYRAILLQYLCNYGYYRQVVRYWKRRPHSVDSDVGSWSMIGMALAATRPKEGRSYLAQWRQRAGVGMWVVANYVLCFNTLRRDDRQEVLESCRDALTLLPHDHAAKGLSHVLGEMCALQDDVEGFRDTWSRFGAYFSGQVEEGEWLERNHRHLLQAIPRLGTCLDSDDLKGFQKRCRRLAWRHFFERIVLLLK